MKKTRKNVKPFKKISEGFESIDDDHEWRKRWFSVRGTDANKLKKEFHAAYELKNKKIKSQVNLSPEIPAYTPDGIGTPWISIGPRNRNGRVKSIAVHPTNENIVYAGAASGGVWKTQDGGESWKPLWHNQESLAIGSIAIAPSDPDTIYAGTGEYAPNRLLYPLGTGVYVSVDAGKTWTQTDTATSSKISRILVSPNDSKKVYVAGIAGFQVSIDGGVSWSPPTMDGEISDAIIDPNNPDIIQRAKIADLILINFILCLANE